MDLRNSGITLQPAQEVQHNKLHSMFCMLGCERAEVMYSGKPAGDGSTSGAADFWGTMMGAGDVQRVVPAARWDMDAVYSPDILPAKMSINVRSA